VDDLDADDDRSTKQHRASKLMGEYWYPFDFQFTRELAMRRLADFPIPFESYYPPTQPLR
jgi:hypothetical protein